MQYVVDRDSRICVFFRLFVVKCLMSVMLRAFSDLGVQILHSVGNVRKPTPIPTTWLNLQNSWSWFQTRQKGFFLQTIMWYVRQQGLKILSIFYSTQHSLRCFRNWKSKNTSTAFFKTEENNKNEDHFRCLLGCDCCRTHRLCYILRCFLVGVGSFLDDCSRRIF